MNQVSLSRTLTAGASYYAGVGGIATDGSVTSASINQTMVDAYNSAITDVQNATYYNTQMLLEDQHEIAMSNLNTAVDSLVAATQTFATVQAVATMAAEADTVNEQVALQTTLTSTDMQITDADVAEYNSSLADVEKYAQEAGAYLAASQNTNITAGTDAWAANTNVKISSYTSVTYDATSDLLFMAFVQDGTNYTNTATFEGYLTNSFKTADEIYQTGIVYAGQ